MPSKTSKPSRNTRSPLRPSLWKDETACSEAALLRLAREFAEELGVHDLVLLEGPMGVGKTTFSRALLQGLGVTQPPEGSPTFAIAHEYRGAKGGDIVHADLYRLRSEAELEDAGIEAYVWERDALVLIEWASLWPAFEASLPKRVGRGALWRVDLSFVAGDPALRGARISKL